MDAIAKHSGDFCRSLSLKALELRDDQVQTSNVVIINFPAYNLTAFAAYVYDSQGVLAHSRLQIGA